MRRVLAWSGTLVLLTPALLLTFTRLVEPSAGAWVRLESFTPLALVPYAVLLLAFLVALIRRRRPVVVTGALVAAIGLALHAWWFAPMLTGSAPEPRTGAEPIRVMTANLYLGRADGIELVRSAVEEDIDLLVVQEVTGETLVEMERAGLDTRFPHRAGEPGESSEGTMVFSRTELSEPVPLDTTWDAFRVTGDLSLIAVHPHAPTEMDRWRRDHELVREAAEEAAVDLVVGDFNATLDHRPMRELADTGYRSATELANAGWQPTWPWNGEIEVLGVPVPHLVQIDHVLVGQRLAAVETHTVDIVGSDHKALVAEIAVR